jgi:hypothetical protein
MAADDIQQINELTKTLAGRKPVMGEYEEVIERVTDAGDPSALPALRKALNAAVEYQRWSASFSDPAMSEQNRRTPGAWMLQGIPHYAERYVSSLRAAIAACTSAGVPIVDVPAKKWWQFWK